MNIEKAHCYETNVNVCCEKYVLHLHVWFVFSTPSENTLFKVYTAISGDIKVSPNNFIIERIWQKSARKSIIKELEHFNIP